MQNVILHLDMNSYFATVEQQDNPVWRGKVLGVCEHLGGIIIAASIEAKKWGIKTGTPVWEAKKIYPKIILTHTRAEAYRQYNRKLVKLVSDYTDKVEVYSIDECFLDITRVCNVRCKNEDARYKNKEHILHPISYILNYANPFEEAIKIAKEIKQRMKKEVGDYLTCSIGIAENKLLAKIASDMQKPDGLVVIIENQNAKIKMQNLGVFSFAKNELYNHLKLTDIPGIGRRQEKNLNQLGIKTLSDLKNCPLSHLAARFGPISGYHLYNMGQLKGTWKEQVRQGEEIKSIGHMYTLPKEYRAPEFFGPVLYKLCEMVAQRMRKQELMGNVIYVFAHDKDCQGFGNHQRLGFDIYDGREIFIQAINICQEFAGASPDRGPGRRFPDTGGRARPPQFKIDQIKLIGVTVAGLKPRARQLSLFGDEERTDRLTQALDKINQKYGGWTICRAPVLKAKYAFKDSIGFGRLREFGKRK